MEQRMSYYHAARVFRAIRGDWRDFPDITFEDIVDLDISGDTFEEFVERNKAQGVQFYEEKATTM